MSTSMFFNDLAYPPATIVAKTASMVIGGSPKLRIGKQHSNKHCYVSVLVLLDHKMVFSYT
jgi:hypothetical protein